MKSVYLIGFMGAGKTTFGKKLAHRLQMPFIDLDEMVCKYYDINAVKELVEMKGFDFFRKAEADMLKVLPANDAVISTGGGTPCYFDSLEWMKANGTVVFLNVNEGVILSRLKTTDLEERPLLKELDEEGLKKFIHDTLAERLPFYTQAHISFDPVKEGVEELLTRLH